MTNLVYVIMEKFQKKSYNKVLCLSLTDLETVRLPWHVKTNLINVFKENFQKKSYTIKSYVCPLSDLRNRCQECFSKKSNLVRLKIVRKEYFHIWPFGTTLITDVRCFTIKSPIWVTLQHILWKAKLYLCPVISNKQSFFIRV